VTDTNVVKLAQPGTFADSLTEILRDGAHALPTQAVEMEVANFLGRYSDLKTESGHQRVVRHIQTPNGAYACRHLGCGCRDVLRPDDHRTSP
jgi:putative transposase